MSGVTAFQLLGKLAIDGVDKAEKELESIGKTGEKTAKSTKQLGATYTELQDDIKASEERLKGLKSEHANVVLQQGKNSKSAKELETQMKELNDGIELDKKRLKEAEQASKDFTTTLGKSANEVKTAGERFQELGTKAGELGKKMALGLAGLATAAIAGVEATREFRQDYGKLETTFQTTNQEAGTAERTFKALFGVLGEDDTAIETANHLAMMTNNEKDLKQWTDILTGVYATFGDSLPLEGLAEAANETARVGQVTGPLADALNWAGISEDEFNAKLEKTNSTAERERMIREALNGLYGEASATYKDVNGNVIANNEAQAELNMQLADAMAKVEPLITQGKIFLAEVLVKAQPLITWIIDNINILAPIVLGFMGALFALNIASKVMAFIPIIKALFAVLSANPIGLVITAVALLVTGFIALWNNCEGFRNFWKNLWEGLKKVVSSAVDFIVKWFNKIVSFVKTNWQALLLMIVNPFAGAFKLLYDNCEGFRNFIDKFISGIKNAITKGFNAVVNGIKNSMTKARDTVKGIIDTIKGFFDFTFKIPKIKLPRFSIKPSGWKIGDLLKGSIPKLGIEWYAKAMNNPMLLDEPTAFGFSSSGNIRVGGEAGNEIVGGANTIMGMIGDAVSSNNGGIEDKLDKLIYLFQNLTQIMSSQQVVLSTGELVGALTGPMDKSLGALAEDRRRGR